MLEINHLKKGNFSLSSYLDKNIWFTGIIIITKFNGSLLQTKN